MLGADSSWDRGKKQTQFLNAECDGGRGGQQILSFVGGVEFRYSDTLGKTVLINIQVNENFARRQNIETCLLEKKQLKTLGATVSGTTPGQVDPRIRWQFSSN